eukprot:12368589-Prorocentrum_lima.AAC.1
MCLVGAEVDEAVAVQLEVALLPVADQMALLQQEALLDHHRPGHLREAVAAQDPPAGAPALSRRHRHL